MIDHLPRRTKLVWLAIQQLAADNGASNGISLADIGAFLRTHDTPLGAWEIRGELTALEELELVRLDPATGRWHAAQATPRKERSARAS